MHQTVLKSNFNSRYVHTQKWQRHQQTLSLFFLTTIFILSFTFTTVASHQEMEDPEFQRCQSLCQQQHRPTLPSSRSASSAARSDAERRRAAAAKVGDMRNTKGSSLSGASKSAGESTASKKWLRSASSSVRRGSMEAEGTRIRRSRKEKEGRTRIHLGRRG